MCIRDRSNPAPPRKSRSRPAPSATALIYDTRTCVERCSRETASDETCGLSCGRVDGVAAVGYRVDASASTRSSSSSFSALSQYENFFSSSRLMKHGTFLNALRTTSRVSGEAMPRTASLSSLSSGSTSSTWPSSNLRTWFSMASPARTSTGEFCDSWVVSFSILRPLPPRRRADRVDGVGRPKFDFHTGRHIAPKLIRVGPRIFVGRFLRWPV